MQTKSFYREVASNAIFLLKFSAIILLAIGIFYLVETACSVALKYDSKKHSTQTNK